MTVKPRRPRKAPPAAPAPVVWRGGVHLVGTPLWCDAERTREACFVSHADLPHDGVRRHRQIIATETTLQLLPGSRPQSGLAVPYGHPFSLGTSRVELFPSGHCLGAASIAVEVDGKRIVYAGAVKTTGDDLAGAAETRPCDTLVIDATFGHPRFRFPAPRIVAAELRTWLATAVADGAVPIVLASPLARAPDVLALIGDSWPIRVHRSVVDVVRRLRGTGRLGAALPQVRRLDGNPAAGDVVLWPIEHRGAAAIARIRRSRIALVDGWAADPAAVRRLSVDAAFPWSARAGYDDLLGYVSASGASQVFLLGTGAEDLAAALTARKIDVRPLGPPRQLELWGQR